MLMIKVFESKMFKWIPLNYIFFFIIENDKLVFFYCLYIKNDKEAIISKNQLVPFYPNYAIH